jgi:hypothetical protein
MRHVIEVGNSKDASSGAALQFKDCLDNSKMGEITAKAFLAGDFNSSRISCSATSGVWKGYQVSAQATNMPSDLKACSAFQNTFVAEAQQCMSTVGSFKYGAAVAGGVIGGVCLIACCVAACYCGYNYCSDNDCKPTCMV